jgi:hypothetical protein
MYLGCSIIIIIYPILSLSIGGRDGVDGGGVHWMMHSIYRAHHLALVRSSSLLGMLGICFGNKLCMFR